MIPTTQQLSAYLQDLGDRERLMLLVGLPLALLLALYLLLWRPLMAEQERLQGSIASKQEQLLWMEQAAARLTALERRPAAHAQRANGSMQQRVSALASSRGLKITRLEPASEGALDIWLDSAPFSALLDLLGATQQQGMLINSLTVRKLPAAGTVKVKLRVQEPA